MSATYSINNGTIYESIKMDTVNSVLINMPNNSKKLITPKDFRNSIYTTWENVSFKPTTISSSTVEYIGIDQSTFKEKIFFGKKQTSGLKIMNNTLLNSDVDIFLYNTKSDTDLSQQNTKIAILAGTNSTDFTNTPYISNEIYGGSMSFNIHNKNSNSGNINMQSDYGNINLNGIVLPSYSKISASASNGYSMIYRGGTMSWELASGGGANTADILAISASIKSLSASVNSMSLTESNNTSRILSLSASINSLSASINTTNATYSNFYATLNTITSSIYSFSSSINSLSASRSNIGVSFSNAMALLPNIYSSLNSITTSIVSITSSIYSFSASINSLSASNTNNINLNSKAFATGNPVAMGIGSNFIVVGTAYGGTWSSNTSNITPGGSPWGYTVVINKSGYYRLTTLVSITYSNINSVSYIKYEFGAYNAYPNVKFPDGTLTASIIETANLTNNNKLYLESIFYTPYSSSLYTQYITHYWSGTAPTGAAANISMTINKIA